MIGYGQITFRLILSVIAGGLVGYEREIKNRPAGLRTHVLVAVGSALLMMISKYGFDSVGDPARLAAQVVTGVGFLGAGTIMKTDNDISGLTTAASLWVCSGIGLALGSGYFFGGLITTLIVLGALVMLRMFEGKLVRKDTQRLHVKGFNRLGLIGDIGKFLGDYSISIREIKIVDTYPYLNKKQKIIEVSFAVQGYRLVDCETICSEVYRIRGVREVYLENKLLENKVDTLASFSEEINI